MKIENVFIVFENESIAFVSTDELTALRMYQKITEKSNMSFIKFEKVSVDFYYGMILKGNS